MRINNKKITFAQYYRYMTAIRKSSALIEKEDSGRDFNCFTNYIFKGSPRHCQQGYQDSMALMRRFGKPDLFITFTCNPNWDEITRNLHTSNKVLDEPDLVDRVFHLKLKELLDDLKKKEYLGRILAYAYVIEFQKRGFPHAHILLILDN
ncbi:hypothetical protein ANCCAN_08183 [Ancylostoma caninum]|uniref:Helitron helicase-like domain-containing protein n=1 Tax=Ancylostoma caninum TaxID=29170 RepID=A0A368GN86_ANCCA|nr:hypothetical protein ANCCAN_08183 [Ancylostoma caninum]